MSKGHYNTFSTFVKIKYYIGDSKGRQINDTYFYRLKILLAVRLRIFSRSSSLKFKEFKYFKS